MFQDFASELNILKSVKRMDRFLTLQYPGFELQLHLEVGTQDK